MLAPVSDGSRLQELLESSRSFPLLDPGSILFCRSTDSNNLFPFSEPLLTTVTRTTKMVMGDISLGASL